MSTDSNGLNERVRTVRTSCDPTTELTLEIVERELGTVGAAPASPTVTTRLSVGRSMAINTHRRSTLRVELHGVAVKQIRESVTERNAIGCTVNRVVLKQLQVPVPPTQAHRDEIVEAGVKSQDETEQVEEASGVTPHSDGFEVCTGTLAADVSNPHFWSKAPCGSAQVWKLSPLNHVLLIGSKLSFCTKARSVSIKKDTGVHCIAAGVPVQVEASTVLFSGVEADPSAFFLKN
mmetsp:Transcript_67648/g.180846  ORF Transcript_67648/g.180846 Transcript_67648/m.180846 type:complete len:234 (+) Transcript_67648:1571-2272(+)